MNRKFPGQGESTLRNRRRVGVIFPALFVVCLAGGAWSGGAGTLLLNGLWQFQAGTSLGTLPGSDWDEEPIRIPSAFNSNSFTNGHGPDCNFFPSYPENWGQARIGWMRREFSVPEAWDAGRRFLRFEGVHLHSVVYLDGVLLGESWEGFLPFEFDVTETAQPGTTHELIVGAETKSPSGDPYIKTPVPHGSFWGDHHAGIWNDVSLENRPLMRIEDVWVRTSVSDATAEFRIRVANDSGVAENVRVDVRISPDSDPGEGFWVNSDMISLIDRSETAIRISWPDARLWSPEDPFLYRATASLIIDDATVDSSTVRFGFREFQIEGPRFLLNNVPIRLRGDAWHWMGIPYQNEEYARLWYKEAQSYGLNTIRLHAQIFPEYYLDIADEMGILIIDESALWASGLDMTYDARTWGYLRDEIERLVVRDRNHPSVIMWSLANEILNAHIAHPYDSLAPEEYTTEMSALRDRTNELDGTRPVFADGDGDGDPDGDGPISGIFPLISFHYPGPQSEWLDGWRDAPKPVSVGEAGAMHYAKPDEFSTWIGPSAYESYSEHLRGVGAELSWMLENYRLWTDHICPFNLVWYGLSPLPFAGTPIDYYDPELSGVQPERIGPYTATLNFTHESGLPTSIGNPISEVIKRELRPVRSVLLDKAHSFYSGDKISRTLYVVNDVSRSADYEVLWYEEIDGATATRVDKSVNVGPASDVVVKADWTIPNVAEPKEATWTIVVMEADVVVDRVLIPIKIHPPELERSDLNIPSIRYYHPTHGSPFERLDIQDTASPPAGELSIPEGVLTLIIGANADLDDGEISRLLQFTAAGGRTILLEGNSKTIEKFGMNVTDRFPRTFAGAYTCGRHPISAKFSEMDLIDWAGDRTVFREGVKPPIAGNGKAVFSDGYGRPVMIDLPVGKGRLIWSGMVLEEKADVEPVALNLLAETVSYAHTFAEEDFFAGGFVGPEGSPLKAYLNRLGVDLWPKSINGDSPVVIVDVSDSAITSLDKSVFEEPAAGTKTFILWGLGDLGLVELGDLLPDGLSIRETDMPHLVKTGSDDQDGIHPGWLYWLEGEENGYPVVGRGVVSSGTDVLDLLVSPPFDWRLYVREGETTRTSAVLRSRLESPPASFSALSKYSLGQREVYLCFLRAESGFPRNDAIVRTFLTNLGVRIHPFGMVADLDSDGKVKAFDLFLFAKFFGAGPSGYRGTSDTVLDGWLRDGDILRFLVSWGQRAGASPSSPKPVLLDPGSQRFPESLVTPEEYIQRTTR